MSFVAKHIIGQDERLVGVARLHGIHLVIGLVWAISLVLLGLALATFSGVALGPSLTNPSIELFGYTFTVGDWMIRTLFAVLGVAIFLAYYISYISTEVALTSKRIIHKNGLIAIEVQEIDLGEIQAASVNQGILGATFDYGKIKLDCKFVGDVFLPVIRKPYRFLRALHKLQEDEKAGKNDTQTDGTEDAHKSHIRK